MTSPCIDRLRLLRKEYGTSAFDHAIRTLMRERVNPDRDKRKAVPWSLLKRKYNEQRGRCSICGLDMVLVRGQVEPDHVDPNRQDFNSPENIRAAHSKCNRSKGSLSIPEQTKRYGKTMVDILGDEV